eukprot:753501-Pyramimonas_sp.AAC.1
MASRYRYPILEISAIFQARRAGAKQEESGPADPHPDPFSAEEEEGDEKLKRTANRRARDVLNAFRRSS